VTVSLAQEDLIISPETDIETPALVVDETILHRNISTMQAFANSVGVGLRPHIKTHKTPQITRLQIAAGAFGVTCAKVGEAEVMVNEAGVQDVLLAYPTLGDHKVERLLALQEKARVQIGIDSLEAAEIISRSLAKHDRSIDVFIELNTGQNRTGVLAGDTAVEFALKLARIRGINVTGVFTHEGHANSAEPDVQEATALAAGHAIVETAEKIRSHGIELPNVSVGSTPAAFYTPTIPGITEMRPGTYVFNDNSAFRYGRITVTDCAARHVATVVSRPTRSYGTLDTGAKSLALDPSKSHPGHGYIVGHPNVKIARLSEEHGVFETPEDEPGLEVGDRVEIIPNHICPTVNLMNELFIARDGKIVDTWTIAARGLVR
jgi:D-serine deaminase-like pyridoxal phosphate-dependent protein